MPIDPARPYAGAARLYLAAGWTSVLPLPRRCKVPPPDGFTGRRGADPTAEQIEEWIRRYPGGNVALRLPAGVVGLDLDLYKPEGRDSYARLVAGCGPLPPTWVSTSRGDGSGIRFYAVPTRVQWSERRAGHGIELVHAGHRYAVVWPSVHPEGRTYRWHEPSGTLGRRVPAVRELPALPATWGRRLTEPPAPRPVALVTHASRGHARGFAAASLAGAVAELAAMVAGQRRNNALNRKAYALAGFVAAGELDQAEVRQRLFEAALANGHVDRRGVHQTLATIDSGLRAGMARPRRAA